MTSWLSCVNVVLWNSRASTTGVSSSSSRHSTAILEVTDFKPAVVTHQGVEYRTRPATAAELEDLLFGWQVEQGVTSNSVLYVKDGCTVGIGTGEQDRVGVAEIAIFKAYTKYADALCFKKLGKAYKDLELEIDQGKADKHLKEEIDPGDQDGQRRAHRCGHDLRRLLPLPGRGGRGHAPGHPGHRPCRRLHAGFRVHPGLQRGSAPGDHGVHGPAGF